MFQSLNIDLYCLKYLQYEDANSQINGIHTTQNISFYLIKKQKVHFLKCLKCYNKKVTSSSGMLDLWDVRMFYFVY